MQAGDRLAEFAVESKLGEGSFSCVYKVRRIDDGQFYAMKKVLFR
jgi:serine/threonine protein kinase